MSVKYTKEQTLSRVRDAIAALGMKGFYSSKVVNYSGISMGEPKEYYSEIISEYLLDHPDLLDDIPAVKRERGYDLDRGDRNRLETGDVETHLGYRLVGKDLGPLGKGLADQVPLQNEDIKKERQSKAVDLLTCKDGKLYVVELKQKNNASDTLLHCVLQCYSYLKTIRINQNELAGAFCEGQRIDEVAGAVLICDGSPQQKELLELGTKYPLMEKLIETLRISVYVLYPGFEVREK